jgi:hypothetical protein
MNQYGTHGFLPVLGKTAASILMIAVGHAEGVPAPPPTEMRDAATHEQLALTLRKSQQEDPMKNMTPTQGEDPSKNLPKDLISQSDIICFRGMATLVPKRAILQIPESCAERLKIAPGAKIVGWAEFFAANRGWITTVEISRVQAEGKEPLAEDTKTQLTQCQNLVVATFLGGPISMLPPPVPPPATPPSTPLATAPATATPTPPPTQPSKP